MRLFKICCWLLPIVLLWCANDLFAQRNQNFKLYLRNGTVEAPANLSGNTARAAFREIAPSEMGRLVIIQFNSIPDEQSVAKLKNAGIELLEYIPDNAYTTVLRAEPDVALLNSVNARAIVELVPAQKIHPVLTWADLPAHVVAVPGKVDVSISYPRSIALEDVRRELARNHFEVVSDSLSRYELLKVRLVKDSLETLAALPWLQYIEPIPGSVALLNDKSTAGTRANMLARGLPSGVKLDGEGVVIGIGDYSSPYAHVDINRRVASNSVAGSYWHGIHVTGTAAGAGIMNEKYAGYAPKATIITRMSRSIQDEAEDLARDFGMVVANHSYGTISTGDVCPGFGAYSSYSNLLDRQANELPYLQNVFAAGNSGLAAACNGFPTGFGNVHGDYASAKNIISVGRTVATEAISPSSSKGPVQDGRIKPDLVAPGTSIYSTIAGDAYDDASGTSMAAPAVTGGAALLYQRYRQLHNQQNPKSALVKALLLNGASDKGLAGPDFSYGFGLMNLFRSVIMIDKGQYLTGALAHQETKEFQMTVPPGTALMKVMLYWNDIAASPLAGEKSLVNNLDLEGTHPSGSTLLPLVPNPATPTVNAVASRDTVNNAEQIVIENPEAGTYTLKVKGTKVPSGPQEYFLVYDIIEKSTVLTYPVGSEHFTKGDAIYISWDSYGSPASTYAVSYSLNNGASWTTINAAVPAGSDQLSWTVPDAATATAKIRLVQNETGVVKESGAFSIMPVPVISLATVQCPTYVAVQWTAVAGVSDYEVMRLQGSEIKPVTVTTDLKYTFSDLSRDSTHYITVRPRINGIPGRRAIVVSRKPDSGTCAGTISDNDMGIDSIISPIKSGRLLTTTSLSGSEQVTIVIRNFDDQPIARPFEVGYGIAGPGSAIHWETISVGMPAQGYLRYTFNKTADLQATGTYSISFFVKLDGDPVMTNNSRTIVIKQLGNPVLTLPYSENFESAAEQTVHFNTNGLVNADKYDFKSPDSTGRLRTYVKPGFAYSGMKALTIDTDSVLAEWSGRLTEVDGTYNLSGYHSQSDEIKLSFRFRRYNPNSAYQDGVYIRGKDTDPWILAYYYDNEQYLPDEKGFARVTIDVSDLLIRNSQDFSTSFQVAWRQNVYRQAQARGYTIDDIQLFKVESDAELLRIVPQTLTTCGSSQELGVVVRNNGTNDLSRVPLQVSVDGNEVYRGDVPVVRAGKDTLFKFEFYSNVFFEGDHLIKAAVGRVFDVNRGNDSATLVFNVMPEIQTFPYLEDFEDGPGGWYTVEPNSAWQFGHPVSTKVNGAASGQNAWKTNLTGPYRNDGVSYLYSPCFYVGGISRAPMLSFSVSMDMEPCNSNSCDVFFVEYNRGYGWERIDQTDWSTNWYNAMDGDHPAWNSQDYTRWHVSSNQVTSWAVSEIRLRFGFKGGSSAAREGIAIDDIHIYGVGQGLVDEHSLPEDSVAYDPLYGDRWIEFGRFNGLTMSLNPNNQNLGHVVVTPFIRQNETPFTNSQYYLPRNYTVSTGQSSYPQPIGVRFYFTDKEVEGILAAPDKTGVVKPKSAYDLTTTKYSGINEDGNLLNNSGGGWSFYPKSAIRTVPYMNGYYIEFQTKTFSEFWLAKDFLGLGDPMPVSLTNFSAKKQTTSSETKQSVLLEWQTTQEAAFSHFEIEVARDKESLLKKQFSKIGEVPGKGGNDALRAYSFTDYFSFVAGTSYYRLKMVDRDGSFEYSAIRPVNFDAEQEWKVFPNPAEKRIFVEFKEKAGKLLTFSISDVEGRVVFTDNVVADGGVQKKEIDLSARAVAPGIYLFKVVMEDREKVFKIIKK